MVSKEQWWYTSDMSKKPQTTGADPKNHDTQETTQSGEQPYIPTATIQAVKPRKLTTKQANLVRLVASGKTKREAYRIAYKSKAKDNTITSEVYKTLSKPHVAVELAKHTDTMKTALIQAVEEAQRRLPTASDRDASPLLTVVDRIANSVIDRVDGKAVQRVQVQSTAVVISLDLSGATGVDKPQDEQKENK